MSKNQIELKHILRTLERESFGIQEESKPKEYSGFTMIYDEVECMPLDVQVKHSKAITPKFGRVSTEITFDLDGNDSESQKVIEDLQEFFTSKASSIRGVIAPAKSKKNIKVLKQSKVDGTPITILIQGFFPIRFSLEGDVVGQDTWRIEGTCDFYELI